MYVKIVCSSKKKRIKRSCPTLKKECLFLTQFHATLARDICSKPSHSLTDFLNINVNNDIKDN